MVARAQSRRRHLGPCAQQLRRAHRAQARGSGRWDRRRQERATAGRQVPCGDAGRRRATSGDPIAGRALAGRPCQRRHGGRHNRCSSACRCGKGRVASQCGGIASRRAPFQRGVHAASGARPTQQGPSRPTPAHLGHRAWPTCSLITRPPQARSSPSARTRKSWSWMVRPSTMRRCAHRPRQANTWPRVVWLLGWLFLSRRRRVGPPGGWGASTAFSCDSP